jgi:undecaprenyl-diphosphatase
MVAASSVVVAGLVALLARRWPAIQAPRVPEPAIVEKVEEHPKFAHHLRRHFDPKTGTGIALIIATVVVGAAAVGTGVLVTMIRSKTGLRLDTWLAQYGSDHASASSTKMMKWISQLGGTAGVVILALIATVIEYVRKPSKALPLFMVLVVGGQFALSNAIKYLVARARPDINRLTGFAGTSFPSGHATAAAATLAAIALITTRNRSRRAKTAGAAIAAGLAVAVALTRVFLGVHWFTDVLGGLLLGWGWFAICSIAFGGRLLTFGQPAVAADEAAEQAPATTGRRSVHS